ncbi:hypothetical protein [Clostridium sp. YIM B02555]|nr:hypothetical protein [Clostridium sp. YIM B02555]
MIKLAGVPSNFQIGCLLFVDIILSKQVVCGELILYQKVTKAFKILKNIL